MDGFGPEEVLLHRLPEDVSLKMLAFVSRALARPALESSLVVHSLSVSTVLSSIA